MSDTTTKTVVWPTLRYTDARAAIDFLVDTFGFVESAAYTEGGRVVHAELAWPGGGAIMLGEGPSDGGLDLPVGTGSIYIVIDNPDELYDHVRASSATIVREIRDEEYGSRGFACRDPEGVFWSFGTYSGD